MPPPGNDALIEAFIPADIGPPDDSGIPINHMSPEHLEHSSHHDPPSDHDEAITPVSIGPPDDSGLPMDHMSPEHLEHSFHQDLSCDLDALSDRESSLGDNDSGCENLPLIMSASPE